MPQLILDKQRLKEQQNLILEITLMKSIRDDPSLSTYKDINGMAKSLINAQKMVGADKVIPGK